MLSWGNRENRLRCFVRAMRPAPRAAIKAGDASGTGSGLGSGLSRCRFSQRLAHGKGLDRSIDFYDSLLVAQLDETDRK